MVGRPKDLCTEDSEPEQKGATVDTGDTAWIIVATALVLFMTLPGLAMFYAGLVRSKSALSAVMHCVSITALASVLWVVIGYALAFGDSQGG